MNQPSNNRTPSYFPFKAVLVSALLLVGTGVAVSSFKESNPVLSDSPAKDSVASVKAFMEVYKVLMSPRCMNCHPKGDRPLQGDSSKIHSMNVKRGKDGKGLLALKCANCHQPENAEANHAPPGNPKWHLPPADMKMVFEGRSPRELALQLLDHNKNGHKSKAQLIEHARDTLVKAGWNMGEERKPPPLTYKEFVAAWDTWINEGAYAPAQ